MKIKLFAAMIIFIFTALFFTSCQDGAGNTAPDTQGNTNDTTGEESKAPPEFTPLDGTDYGGYKFRIYAIDPNVLLFESAVGMINEIAPETETGEPINDAVFRRNTEIETLYNIEIVPTFYSSRDAVTDAARRVILAADDAYDAGFTVGITMPTILGSKSYTYDLFNIPNLDPSKSWWNQKAVSEFSISKQLHIITGDASIFGALSIDAMYRNKELANMYDLENAYDLARQGKWTWDKLIEMCRRVSRDLDGDGVMTDADQYGIYTEYACVRYMLRCCGGRIVKKEADDIPYLAINTETTLKVIDYALASFMDKDIAMVAQDYKFSNYYIDSLMPKYLNNEVLFSPNGIYATLDLRNMECDFEILPYPKLSEQQSQYYAMTSRSYETHIHIPATCSDTARTGAVLEALGYYSRQYVKPAVIDVTVTNKLIRDEDSAEMLGLMLDSREYDIGEYYNWDNLINNLLYSSLQARSNVFASNYAKHEEKIKTLIQKTIDEMLE